MLIDRFKLNNLEDKTKRLDESLKTAMYYGDETIIILSEKEKKLNYYSKKLMCPESGISYPSPEPNTFSFNSPKGMCNECKGLGYKLEIHKEKVIPDITNSIAKENYTSWEKKDSWVLNNLIVSPKNMDFHLTNQLKIYQTMQ